MLDKPTKALTIYFIVYIGYHLLRWQFGG
jgi:hypothetical protein